MRLVHQEHVYNRLQDMIATYNLSYKLGTSRSRLTNQQPEPGRYPIEYQLHLTAAPNMKEH
jgi:hypothetical protein